MLSKKGHYLATAVKGKYYIQIKGNSWEQSTYGSKPGYCKEEHEFDTIEAALSLEKQYIKHYPFLIKKATCKRRGETVFMSLDWEIL